MQENASRMLTDDDVLAALGPENLLPALGDALRRFAAGAIEVAPRSGVGLGSGGKVSHLMMARDNESGRLVTKLIDYDPERPARSGRPSHLGLLTYMADGEIQLLASAAAFTWIRTAATTALAIDLLAAPDARVLAIAGAGPLGHHLAIQIARLRPLREVRYAARSRASAQRRVADLESELSGIELHAADSVADACRDADIIVTASSAVEPILFTDDVADGTVVAAIGAGIAQRSEVDGALLSRAARIYVEDQDTAWDEGGDLIIAADQGWIDHSSTTSLAEVVDAPAQVRSGELVVYKSVGMPWEDLACVQVLADRVVGEPA